jgi:hypothetical protein
LLTITGVMSGDTGEYVCVASTSLGTAVIYRKHITVGKHIRSLGRSHTHLNRKLFLQDRFYGGQFCSLFCTVAWIVSEITNMLIIIQ